MGPGWFHPAYSSFSLNRSPIFFFGFPVEDNHGYVSSNQQTCISPFPIVIPYSRPCTVDDQLPLSLSFSTKSAPHRSPLYLKETRIGRPPHFLYSWSSNRSSLPLLWPETSDDTCCSSFSSAAPLSHQRRQPQTSGASSASS